MHAISEQPATEISHSHAGPIGYGQLSSSPQTGQIAHLY